MNIGDPMQVDPPPLVQCPLCPLTFPDISTRGFHMWDVHPLVNSDGTIRHVYTGEPNTVEMWNGIIDGVNAALAKIAVYTAK